MPPPKESKELGWKCFFALLMFLQVIGLGVLWRTYDAIQSTARQSEINEYKIDHMIVPRIDRLERQTGIIMLK